MTMKRLELATLEGKRLLRNGRGSTYIGIYANMGTSGCLLPFYIQKSDDMKKLNVLLDSVGFTDINSICGKQIKIVLQGHSLIGFVDSKNGKIIYCDQ